VSTRVSRSDDHKRLIAAPIVGEQGAALAKLLTLEMGCPWHETNSLLETGVDAWIELRDPSTGEMLNRWIAAQSKAHEGPFRDEDDSSFTFEFEHRDLIYWLQGNMPVILIVSRPADREAWWRPISHSIERGEGEKVKLKFDKQRDKYGLNSYQALRTLATERVEVLAPAEEDDKAQQHLTAAGLDLPFRAIGAGLLVPAVAIGLKGVTEELMALALIDSGADASYLPYEFANVLGVDLGSCDQSLSQTISGTSSVYVCPEGITARVFGVTFQLEGVFAPTVIPILGRRDFFARFLVEIDQRRQRFNLRPYDELPKDSVAQVPVRD
jgi:hypothetical protein